MEEMLVVAKVNITETTYFENPARDCIRYVEDPNCVVFRKEVKGLSPGQKPRGPVIITELRFELSPGYNLHRTS